MNPIAAKIDVAQAPKAPTITQAVNQEAPKPTPVDLKAISAKV